MHAKGILFNGIFTATPKAAELSTAWHLQGDRVPIIVRFSTGSPDEEVEDTDDSSKPMGFAIRFMEEWRPVRRHTDIITHSVDGFPASTPEELHGFFNAKRDGTLEQYMRDDPTAAAFAQIPKPTPRSFTTQRYYGVNAFKFVGPEPEKKERYFKYRVVPQRGEDFLSEDENKNQEPNFLEREITRYLELSSVSFTLVAQMAEEGDVTNDCTVNWGEDREEIELGTITIEAPAARQYDEQKYMIFDPIPRIPGIEPSDDVLLQYRSGVYLLSGRDRRDAQA